MKIPHFALPFIINHKYYNVGRYLGCMVKVIYLLTILSNLTRVSIFCIPRIAVLANQISI